MYPMRALLAATIFALAGAWVPASRPTPYSRSVARGVMSRAIKILPPTKTQSSEPKIKPVCTVNITGSPTVVVTGFVDAPERTDQFVFDVLHAQNTWGRIVALVPDVVREDPAREPERARRARRARAPCLPSRDMYISRPSARSARARSRSPRSGC